MLFFLNNNNNNNNNIGKEQQQQQKLMIEGFKIAIDTSTDVWNQWREIFQLGVKDPSLIHYYEAGITILCIAGLLLAIVLVYYLVLCMKKTAEWFVGLALQLAFGLFIIIVIMAIFFIVVPWISSSLGFGTLWFTSVSDADHDYMYSESSPSLIRVGSPRFNEETEEEDNNNRSYDTTMLEVDPVTKQKIYVPKVGKSVSRRSKKLGKELLETLFDREMNENLYEFWKNGPDPYWWSWKIVTYGYNSAVSTAVGATKAVAYKGYSGFAFLFKSIVYPIDLTTGPENIVVSGKQDDWFDTDNSVVVE